MRGLCAVALTGSEPRILDVIKVLADSIPRAAAPCLVLGVAGIEIRARWQGISVGNDPIPRLNATTIKRGERAHW